MVGKPSWFGKLQTEARQASNSYGTRAQPVRRVPPLCVCLFCSILYTSSLVQFNPSSCRSRNTASVIRRIWVRRGRRSRPSPWSFLVEKNSVMKPTERTTCPYKNSLHVALAPVVGSLQSGAGLQAWSEEAVILAPQNMKPRGRFRSRPITCAGALA